MLTYIISQEKRNLEDKDPMFDSVVNLILETRKVSASLIQRRLKIGYARSARLLDQLEEFGFIGPSNGIKAREIFIKSVNGQWQVPTPPPEPKIIEEEEVPIKWNKTKYVDDKSDQFEISLGIDEKNRDISFNLERYGNLLIIGSQFTSAVDLLNNILVSSMAKYSPEKLRIIAIDGIRGDLIVPNKASHLLTPLIVEPEKSISALKWSVSEIQRRMKMESQIDNSKVLILINSLNQILMFSPSEIEDNLYLLITQGRKYGFYFVIGADYLSPKMSKEIMANSPAKLVFKPTDKKIARDTGIPESADLTSPDEAILETMFEGKKKITIQKLNPKEIYEEIFE